MSHAEQILLERHQVSKKTDFNFIRPVKNELNSMFLEREKNWTKKMDSKWSLVYPKNWNKNVYFSPYEKFPHRITSLTETEQQDPDI